MTDARTRRRAATERGFRAAAAGAVALSLAFLTLMLGSIAFTGFHALDAAGGIGGIGGIGWRFLIAPDATRAAAAGIGSALIGTAFSVVLAMGIAIPVGVLAALWLEVVARAGRTATIVALGIENLAAVPPILFGLFGLVVLIGALDMPRASPLVAGIVLAMLMMPMIVIAARSAIRAVPPSVREAALAVGASPLQLALDHLLPLALPGILTGAVFAAARALGETTPLILLGMRAFIAAAPGSPADPAPVLPVQIFLWSDLADPGFVARTTAAIAVLLVVSIVPQLAAMALRHRLERRR